MTFDKESMYQQVEHTHSYHRPQHQETMDKMGWLRDQFKSVGHSVVDLCPSSREASLALTHLDQANMWAIAALARHEETPKDGGSPNTTSHPSHD